jgi:hypothetical protein
MILKAAWGARPQAGKESKKFGKKEDRNEMNFNLLVEYSRIHS